MFEEHVCRLAECDKDAELEWALKLPQRKFQASRGGVEVAGWTGNRKIRVRFPAYSHRLWALRWLGDKRRLLTSRCPCQGMISTPKAPSCSWHWVPGSRSKFGNWETVSSIYSWNIAECDMKPQPTNQPTKSLWLFLGTWSHIWFPWGMNVHRSFILFVPQRQCIRSFVLASLYHTVKHFLFARTLISHKFNRT